MAIPFTNKIDLNRFEILNAKFQVLTASPSPEEALFYYDSIIKKFGFYNGSLWLYPDVNDINSIIGGTTSVVVSQEGKTITLSIKMSSALDDGLMSKEDYSKLAAATSLATVETLVKRDSNGDSSFRFISISDPTQGNHATTRQWVEGLLDKTLKQPEAYNPITTSLYPITYSGNAIKDGDTFRIMGASPMGTREVNIEDLLIALVDNPGQVDANWMVAESNRDQATETVKGVAKIATQDEVTSGIDDNSTITPLKLKSALNGLGVSDSMYQEFTTTSLSSFTVDHNFNTPTVSTFIWADNKQVIADTEKLSDNSIKVVFGRTMAVLGITKVQIKVIS